MSCHITAMYSYHSSKMCGYILSAVAVRCCRIGGELEPGEIAPGPLPVKAAPPARHLVLSPTSQGSPTLWRGRVQFP